MDNFTIVLLAALVIIFLIMVTFVMVSSASITKAMARL
jgi:hypothetical protein